LPLTAYTALVAAMPAISSRRVIFAAVRFCDCMAGRIAVGRQKHFVYNRTMNVRRRNPAGSSDGAVARIAAAIGEPARARVLYCLMDGRARTATELSAVAEVGAPTASAHLNRLVDEHLVKVLTQGKHRFYSLDGADVARVLESLSVLAGGSRNKFVPSTPNSLRAARTCYDHIAGTLGVTLHDRFTSRGWLAACVNGGEYAYDVTTNGVRAFQAVGIDVDACRELRRRFACGCLDWSERRFHLGGALGAALLRVALKRKWVTQEAEGRALAVTCVGQREISAKFGVRV
jgi:DNA-binding transcriptional ArsR family regulator